MSKVEKKKNSLAYNIPYPFIHGPQSCGVRAGFSASTRLYVLHVTYFTQCLKAPLKS